MSAAADEMPLLEMLQVLSRTPVSESQLRAVVAVTCGRWCAARGEDNEALRLLAHALELVPDLRPAMRLLYRIYLRRGDVRSAVRYLDQEIRATRHPREAAALYRERGKLVETHFGDRNAALQCYQAALKATPRDLAVLRSVETIALHQGNIFALIGNLEQQLEVLHDPAAVAGILRDLALLEARRGGDLHLAADLLNAALDEVKGHLGLAHDLHRVAELGSDVEMVLRALEVSAEALPAGRRAGPLAAASAVLAGQRERAAAVALLHAAAAAQPAVFSLWRALEEASMASARYDMAARACVGQLAAIGDGDVAARAELYYRLGKLAMLRLDRVSEGLGAVRKALRLDPLHIPALEDACHYLATNESWSQLHELLRAQASNAEASGLSAEERAQALVRAGQVLEENLQETDGARQTYEEALAIDPTSRPALDRLERALHQLGRLDALREHYHAELGRTQAPSRRLFLLSLLSQLAAREADPNPAIKYLVTLLKEVPEHLMSLQLLARLLARAKRPRELLQVTEREISLTISVQRRARLLQRAAELALELGDRKQAYNHLHAALAAVDDHASSIELLDRLLREDGDDHALLDLLRRRLDHTDDREGRVALHLEIAGLLAARLGDQDEALAEIGRLLAAWPNHLPALHRGERLAVTLGEWSRLCAMLDQHIAAARSPRTRALLLYRVALLRSRELGEPAAAMVALRRALALWPELGVARALLVDLCEQNGEGELLRQVALDGLARERSPDQRRAMALRLAEETGDAEAALPYLEAASLAQPADTSCQLRLARAARAGGRPRLAAQALAAASEHLGEGRGAAGLALRCQAALAAERAGDPEAADAHFAAVLAADAANTLAARGRARIERSRGSDAYARGIDALQTAAVASDVALERAAFLTRAADLELRRGRPEAARELLIQAIERTPDYLPASFTIVRVHEALGDIKAAIATLERLADKLTDAGPKADVLCRAGRLALLHPSVGDQGGLAWKLYGRALTVAPASQIAFSGLWVTLGRHGGAGAPVLGDTLDKRLEIHHRTGTLESAELRALARLAQASEGPPRAVQLLERAVGLAGFDAAVYVDLAQLLAGLDRWHDAVTHLQTALKLEGSPERIAALHFFLGEAGERAHNGEAAIQHYVEASRGGYHPRSALLAADRLASAIGSLGQRIAVLRLLVERGEAEEKIRGLRELAEIHLQLGEPRMSIDFLRELLREDPADIAALTRLAELLIDQDRADEAHAARVTGIAAHRMAVRQRGLRNRAGEADAALIVGLQRLFDATEEIGGAYTCAAILEVVDPKSIPAGRECDTLMPEAWPLPVPREDAFSALTSGKDATIAAMQLLREGLTYLIEIPGVPEAPEVIQGRRSLPSVSSVATVTQALAQALGVPEPDVYLHPNDDNKILAWASGSPSLVIGRKINAAPTSAFARDKLGRALLRLALGGDHVVQRMTTPQILGLLVGLCESVGVDLELPAEVDRELSDRVVEILSTGAASLDFGEHAERLARCVHTFDPVQLRAAFVIAEDRAAVLCAGDPRITIRELRRTGALTSARGQALLSYLISDDHLSLRRTLGYSIEQELDIDDVEEIA